MVALVQSAATLPVMLFSILAGAIADSFDRRRVLLIAQSFMMMNAALLTVVVASGLITPWLLLTFLFLAGCGTALHAPSWQASVGDVVPREAMVIPQLFHNFPLSAPVEQWADRLLALAATPRLAPAEAAAAFHDSPFSIRVSADRLAELYRGR